MKGQQPDFLLSHLTMKSGDYPFSAMFPPKPSEKDMARWAGGGLPILLIDQRGYPVGGRPGFGLSDLMPKDFPFMDMVTEKMVTDVHVQQRLFHMELNAAKDDPDHELNRLVL